jgi:hypothetical protein
VKRTGQEELCTVAAVPSPIGRPKPRPKVARTLPKLQQFHPYFLSKFNELRFPAHHMSNRCPINRYGL